MAMVTVPPSRGLKRPHKSNNSDSDKDADSSLKQKAFELSSHQLVIV